MFLYTYAMHGMAYVYRNIFLLVTCYNEAVAISGGYTASQEQKARRIIYGIGLFITIFVRHSQKPETE